MCFFNPISYQVYGTAESRIFHRTPAGTQRKGRQGEKGMGVAMGCYLSHANPPPAFPPPPTLRICRTACGHVIRIS